MDVISKWSGVGQPPTRRKLHKWRQAQLKLRQAELAGDRRDIKTLDYSWNKRTRGAIVNAERFEELWTT